MSDTFDPTNFLKELDAGVYVEKLSRALRDAALGVVQYGDNGVKGKVTLDFTMTRIGESNQLEIAHKITQSIPTPRGKKGEENTTRTPVFVAGNGAMSIMPDTQTGFEFDKKS